MYTIKQLLESNSNNYSSRLVEVNLNGLEHLFFLSKEESDNYLQTLKEFNREKQYCEFLLEGQEKNKSSNRSSTLLSSSIGFLEKQINICKTELDELTRKTDITKMDKIPIYNILCLVNNTNSFSSLLPPNIIELREKGLQRLKEYHDNVLIVLKDTSSNLNRQDLLDYVVGIKGDLFAYYGFETYIPKEKFSSKINSYFSHPQVEDELIWYGREGHYSPIYFTYSLDNDSAYDFEDEIRTDLKGRNVPLPPRFILTREYTKPITPEIQQVQDIIMPILTKYFIYFIVEEETSQQNPSQEELDMVINTLVKHNGWEKFNLTSDNFQIHSLLGEGNTTGVLMGFIKIGNCRKPFTMKINDCLIIIQRNIKQNTASRHSSLEVLTDMKEQDEHKKYEASLQKPGSITVCASRNFNLDD